MQEVSIRLRFLRECLGSAKRPNGRGQTIFYMLRDPQHRIMFLPTWWHDLMSYAAKVRNFGQQLVRRINWDPTVDGSVRGDWRRTVVPASRDSKQRARYALHEAFPPGAVIGVNAVLPDGLSIEAFQDLLTVAGTYKGISPFRSQDANYGTFEVVSVKRTACQTPPGNVTEGSEHAPVDSTLPHADRREPGRSITVAGVDLHVTAATSSVRTQTDSAG